jgi:hypothetical protein
VLVLPARKQSQMIMTPYSQCPRATAHPKTFGTAVVRNTLTFSTWVDGVMRRRNGA